MNVRIAQGLFRAHMHADEYLGIAVIANLNTCFPLRSITVANHLLSAAHEFPGDIPYILAVLNMSQVLKVHMWVRC